MWYLIFHENISLYKHCVFEQNVREYVEEPSSFQRDYTTVVVCCQPGESPPRNTMRLVSWGVPWDVIHPHLGTMLYIMGMTDKTSNRYTLYSSPLINFYVWFLLSFLQLILLLSFICAHQEKMGQSCKKCLDCSSQNPPASTNSIHFLGHKCRVKEE